MKSSISDELNGCQAALVYNINRLLELLRLSNLESDELKLRVKILEETIEAYKLIPKELRVSEVISVLSSIEFYDFFNGHFQEYLRGSVGNNNTDLRNEVKRIFNL